MKRLELPIGRRRSRREHARRGELPDDLAGAAYPPVDGQLMSWVERHFEVYLLCMTDPAGGLRKMVAWSSMRSQPSLR